MLQFHATVLALFLGSAAASAADACDRSCLESFVDRYLDAVAANRPDQVPLAAGVRFTEDGQQLPIGDGLWNTLRARGPYRLFVTDVPGLLVDGGVVPSIGADEADRLLAADGFEGGIVPKLRAAVQAARLGLGVEIGETEVVP